MINIVQQLNETSATAVAIVWTIVWQSTLLAVVFVGVAWWLKRASPAVRYWLWQILILKIFVMPLWIVAIPWPVSTVRPATPAPAGLNRSISLEPPAMEEMATLSDVETIEKPPEANAPNETMQRITVGWQAWLLIVWVVVVVVQCTRIVIQWIRLNRLLRSGETTDARLRMLAQEAAGQLNVAGTIRTVVTLSSTSPFVCGIVRPTLVLPKEVSTSLSDTQLRQVLLHELAHVKRKELLFGWIPEICQLVWFFHPVVRYAVYRLRLEYELACDQLAMFHTRSRSGDYADTLIEVISDTNGTPILNPSAIPTAGFARQSQRPRKK